MTLPYISDLEVQLAELPSNLTRYKFLDEVYERFRERVEVDGERVPFEEAFGDDWIEDAFTMVWIEDQMRSLRPLVEAANKVVGGSSPRTLKRPGRKSMHRENHPWIAIRWRAIRGEVESDRKADLEIQRLYRDEFDLTISTTEIRRATGRLRD